MALVVGTPTFFATLDAWRAWLLSNHATEEELWVGFHKRASGRPSITWPESVDGALAFGWIDGVRKSLDETAYVIRFTRRNKGSNWSAINIERVAVLTEAGLMHAAGLRAFQERTLERSGVYAYEQRHDIVLAPDFQARFEKNKKAFRFFSSQPPWYRKTATYWVMSAKREDTRVKRLATLIADSAALRTIGPLTRPIAAKAPARAKGKAGPPKTKPRARRGDMIVPPAKPR